ncbi:hypothetical protein F020042I8_02430 [Bacteroides xylanisolvens]|jgi:hypothetical protein
MLQLSHIITHLTLGERAPENIANKSIEKYPFCNSYSIGIGITEIVRSFLLNEQDANRRKK